jgi:hypothetical protein
MFLGISAWAFFLVELGRGGSPAGPSIDIVYRFVVIDYNH